MDRKGGDEQVSWCRGERMALESECLRMWHLRTAQQGQPREERRESDLAVLPLAVAYASIRSPDALPSPLPSHLLVSAFAIHSPFATCFPAPLIN